MRPERSRSTKRGAAVSQARMLVKAHLWWLHGYPVAFAQPEGLEWQVVSGPKRSWETVVLTRKHLSESTRALQTLSRMDPSVVRRVVKSPRKWFERVRQILEALKPAVHHQVGQLPSPFRGTNWFDERTVKNVHALWKAARVIRPAVNSLGWMLATQPGRFAKLVARCLEHAETLNVVAQRPSIPGWLLDVVRFALLLEAEKPETLTPLLEFASNPAIWRTPTRASRDLSQLRTDISKLARSGTVSIDFIRRWDLLGLEVLSFAYWALEAESRARMRALLLLPHLELDRLADEWGRWAARTAAGDLECDPPPLPEDGDTGLDLICWYAESADPNLYGGALMALPHLPSLFSGDRPQRVPMLEHWKDLREHASGHAVGHLLIGFTDYLRQIAGQDGHGLLPWVVATRAPRYWEQDEASVFDIDREILTRPRGEHGRRALYHALAEFAAAVNWDPAWHATSAALRCILNLSFALRLGGPLKRFAPSLGELFLAPSRPTPHKEESWTREQLAVALILYLLREHPGQREELARCLHFLEVYEWPKRAAQPEPQQDRVWMQRYPEVLCGALEKLCLATPDAAKMAEGILGRHFPDAEAIRVEIDALQRRLDAGVARGRSGIEKRLNNLRKRLTDPGEISLQRLKTLERKLEDAALREAANRVLSATKGAVRARMAELLGEGAPPSWATETRYLNAITHLASLDQDVRDLAWRLLRVRAGSPPWDLRDAAENREFLDQLRTCGIDPTPWVDGIGVHEVESASGATWKLALEDDPLEIMLIGHHFGTCIRPGGMYYYSVFTTAADINKRVLLARDQKGRVQGRCIFALTVAGGLLLFEPYAHDSRAGFGDMALHFAEELARRMHTTIVPDMEVPNLVASRWFNERPVDFTQQFEFLSSDSEWRQSIPELSADQFIDSLREQLHPAKLDESTLPAVLALKEVRERQDLSAALIPYLRQVRALPLSSLAIAYSICSTAGAEPALTRSLRRQLEAEVISRGSEQSRAQNQALQLLARSDAAKGLRLLRATREPGVTRWDQEEWKPRQDLIVETLSALGRTGQAKRLREGPFRGWGWWR